MARPKNQRKEASRACGKPALRLNVQLPTRASSTNKTCREIDVRIGFHVTASMATMIFQRPCFITSALASSRLLLYVF